MVQMGVGVICLAVMGRAIFNTEVSAVASKGGFDSVKFKA